MADQVPLMARDRPPAPVRAVKIILIVISSLILLLALSELVGGVWDSDPGGQQSSTEGGQIVLGLLGIWTGILVGRGWRGGRILALLAGLLFLCSGTSLTQLPFPFSLFSIVPLLAGIAVVLLLLVPEQSREWFKPDKWASTR
jgi:predicted transporter